MRDGGRPCRLDVEVRCLRRPVHSGQKGGPVPDAAQILCRLIAEVTARPRWREVVTVAAIHSHPFLGCSNRITDAARARLQVRPLATERARLLAGRIARSLTARPPHGARVIARVSSWP